MTMKYQRTANKPATPGWYWEVQTGGMSHTCQAATAAQAFRSLIQRYRATSPAHWGVLVRTRFRVDEKNWSHWRYQDPRELVTEP